MKRLIIKIYDYFSKYPAMGWGAFLVLTAVLVWSVLTLQYKEDISDFLPLDADNQTALAVYQDISGANNVYAIISSRDSANADQQQLADGIDMFVEKVEDADSLGYVQQVVSEVDMDKMMEVVDSVYANIPFFLTDSDYARMDSLLAQPGYIGRQLAEDKQLLLFPSSNILSQNMGRDPLNLFTPVLNRMKGGGMSIDYETYDSHILSPDGTRAIAIVKSTFGASESENNARLVAMLTAAADSTEQAYPDLDVHVIGGPVIAVANASRIKDDSVLAIALAGILILALLIYVFRRVRNILLIVVSVGWGWLFAMGGIALYYDSVSIIVIGIASVILGIAINYPLHLIDHLKDSEHPRAALREIISPLVTGNITTVGAFLCLVPLNSPALHDLGLFASMLLIGTILFVLIFLPHVVRTRKSGQKKLSEPVLISRIAGLKLENSKALVWCVLVLTAVFGYFSLHTEFDSDMRNINYMTDEQRADFAYFQRVFSKTSSTETVYIVSSSPEWDETLARNEAVDATIDSLVAAGSARRGALVADFLTSQATQKGRLDKWTQFVAAHRAQLTDSVRQTAVAEGFSPEAFDDFGHIIDNSYTPRPFDSDNALVASVFAANVSHDAKTGRKSVVQTVQVNPADIESVKAAVKANREFGGLAFDVKSMNGSIANTLSDDFNYIGFACGCIVFLFLWFSFGNIELAIVSFLPMAVSWIWILGIMSILDIKFNIVNVILATFIFGQGDDYTIFMTEGLSYEFAYRRKLLASYKNSIVVSALIMFIGIGTLIFAEHPALRSLGQVTVVGMLSVVLMAYLFPPLVFNWLVRSRGQVRYRPITLRKIWCTTFCATVFFAQLLSAHVLGFFLFVVTRPTARKRLLFHRYNSSLFRFDIKRMPGIKFSMSNPTGEDFSKPAVVISNHQSLLDSFCLIALSPKLILTAHEHIRVHPLVGHIFRWSGFLSVLPGKDDMLEHVRKYVAEGFSVAVFPEGDRPDSIGSRVARFHKGAFFLAEELKLDIVPVYLEGILQLMPKRSALSNGGPMYIEVGKRIPYAEVAAIGDTLVQARAFRHHYLDAMRGIYRKVFGPTEVKPIVFDKYLYKGSDIERSARRTLRALVEQGAAFHDIASGTRIVVVDKASQGEPALMLALMYPDNQVLCAMENAENREILNGCTYEFVNNVTVAEKVDADAAASAKVYAILRKGSDAARYALPAGADIIYI